MNDRSEEEDEDEEGEGEGEMVVVVNEYEENRNIVGKECEDKENKCEESGGRTRDRKDHSEESTRASQTTDLVSCLYTNTD